MAKYSGAIPVCRARDGIRVMTSFTREALLLFYYSIILFLFSLD